MFLGWAEPYRKSRSQASFFSRAFLRCGNRAALWEVCHILFIRGRRLGDLSPLFLLVSIYLLWERLCLVKRIGVRCDETLTVPRFEFVENGDEATEDRKHFCSIAYALQSFTLR